MGKEWYRLDAKEFRPLQSQATVEALKNGQADAANIFSTDPAIAANGGRNNFVWGTPGGARIITIVDAYDAMMTDQPWEEDACALVEAFRREDERRARACDALYQVPFR